MHLTLSYVNRNAVYDVVQQLFNLFYTHLCVSDNMKAGQIQGIWKQNRMGTMINTFTFFLSRTKELSQKSSHFCFTPTGEIQSYPYNCSVYHLGNRLE